MKFNVTVTDRGLLEHLDRMIRNAQDLRLALEAVADDFQKMEERAFATHGVSNEHPWAPISPEWQRAKAKRGSAQPLVLKGYLSRSLRTPGAKYSVRRVTKQMVTLGTRDPVAHLHQGGTKPRYVKTYKGKPLSKPRYAGRLPARPVVFVTKEDQARWKRTFAQHVMALGR